MPPVDDPGLDEKNPVTTGLRLATRWFVLPV